MEKFFYKPKKGDVIRFLPAPMNKQSMQFYYHKRKMEVNAIPDLLLRFAVDIKLYRN